MEQNPIINAYLDSEKGRIIALINETDQKFSLWLAEFEKNTSWDGPPKASVTFGSDKAEFDILPGEGIKNTANYCRDLVAFEKESSLVYLNSVIENMRREYSDKPDFVEDLIKFRVALIEKIGLMSFFSTGRVLQSILLGTSPFFKARRN